MPSIAKFVNQQDIEKNAYISGRCIYFISNKTNKFFQSSECSLPSLNSPSDSLGDEDHMSTFMSLQMDDDPELGITAPYVAMNACDDLPLVMSHDIMWNTNDKKSTIENGSSLAQLLRSSVNSQLKESDHGGGGDGGGLTPAEQGLLDEFYGDKSEFVIGC